MQRSLLLAVLIGLMLCPSLKSLGQSYLVSGKVYDSQTKEPLPFVNIVINPTTSPRKKMFGGTTDMDGKFRFSYPEPIVSLQFSYVGYHSQVIPIPKQKENIQVKLQRTELELAEVVIYPTENPAHRIIRNVVKNRDVNDPEKLSSFQYLSYDKVVFTLDTSKNTLSDSVVRMSNTKVGVQFTMSDSIQPQQVDDSLQKFLEKQHLFIMENVVERKFKYPDKNFNNVLASKISGLKDPLFVFLTTQIQSFSFYKEFIKIYTKSYVNPISPGSTGKYLFVIRDTTFQGNDTLFTISFRPRKNTNFEGLKGVLTIHTDKWAIQNVIAEPADDQGGIGVTIQQMYEKVDSLYWFPVQLNTEVSFKGIKVGNFYPLGSGKSYIRNILINPELRGKEFNHYEVELAPDAGNRNQTYWNQFRVDSLTLKDQKTYQVIDSLGKEANFDRMVKTFQTLMSGRIPYKFIDFELNRILGYNQYEGLRLGLGIQTNAHLSKVVTVGGYGAYAFKDHRWKYGGNAGFLLHRRNELMLKVNYFNDVMESGCIRFFDDNPSLLLGDYRGLLYRKMDQAEFMGGSIGFRTRKYLLVNLAMSRTFKKTYDPDYSIQKGNITILRDEFIFTELSLGMKWAYKEKFIETGTNRYSLGTNYPIVWIQYTRGIKDLFKGDFDYNRIDLKVRKTFAIRYLGNLSMQLHAGYVDAYLPWSNLFNGIGSYRLFTLFAPNSFATLRMNEFVMNKYASLFITHDFGKLLWKGKKFSPEFAIATNVGIGALDREEDYRRTINLETMEKGYFESGLQINNLLNLQIYNLGAAVYYRWGPYAFPHEGENFSYRITLFVPF
ncbi:MAG: carboxypeptidase-like regulatory domain-containing protein [Bacteroidetes bacterium]|nr:carboxypeptidase-like regulatory domain-containing protein [Bacteroidota bacterium]